MINKPGRTNLTLILMMFVVVTTVLVLAIFWDAGSPDPLVEEILNNGDEETINDEENVEDGIIFRTGPDFESDELRVLTYTNSYDGVTVDYHSDWEFISAIIEGDLHERIVPTEKVDYYESFYVAIGADTIYLSGEELQEFFENYPSEYISLLQEEGWDIISETQIEFFNDPGWEIVSTKREAGITMKKMNVYSIQDNLIYYLTFVSEESEFDRYLGEVEFMKQSFNTTDFI